MKKGLLKKVITIALSMSLVLSLSACAKKGDSAANLSQIEKIKKAGKLVIGTSADYPPYEFHKSVNGKDEIIGFDIEIAKEIAKDLGVTVEIKDMKFDGLLSALDSGNVDMVISSMNPDAERAKSVDFSKIYYTATNSVIINAANKDTFKSLESLKGKKIGAQKSTMQEKLAQTEIQNADIKALGKVTDLVLELKNNKVDALIVETPVAKAYVEKNTGMAIIDGVSLKTEEGGAAVAAKKGSKELIDSVNKTLDRLMKDNMVEKFFNEANDQVE